MWRTGSSGDAAEFVTKEGAGDRGLAVMDGIDMGDVTKRTSACVEDKDGLLLIPQCHGGIVNGLGYLSTVF